MSARIRRLISEYENLKLKAIGAPVRYICGGTPPEMYSFTLECRGFAKGDHCEVEEIASHRFSIQYMSDFPRRPPVLTWQSPIFHPNILPPENSGGVCLGGWSPQETLDLLLSRIYDIVTYQNFSLKSPLNPEAAQWAKENPELFPLDGKTLFAPKVIKKTLELR